jgi:hypothetical protein
MIVLGTCLLLAGTFPVAGLCEHPFVAGFRYLLGSPQGRYLGEYVVAVPDWSEGDPFSDKEGRRFCVVFDLPAPLPVGRFRPTCSLRFAV